MAGSQLGIRATKTCGVQKGRGLSLKGLVPAAGPGPPAPTGTLSSPLPHSGAQVAHHAPPFLPQAPSQPGPGPPRLLSCKNPQVPNPRQLPRWARAEMGA